MREATRVKFERELMKQRLRKIAMGAAGAVVIAGAIVLAYSRDQGPEVVVSETTVPATVKFWYQAPKSQAQGQDLISVTATLANGRDVQAGSVSHHTAQAGERIDLVERHYKSGRITYVWK